MIACFTMPMWLAVISVVIMAIVISMLIVVTGVVATMVNKMEEDYGRDGEGDQ